MDFIKSRSRERILIVVIAGISIVLGFYLFLTGRDAGQTEFSWGKFVVSGQGPGIVFVAGGICVLIVCLCKSVRYQTNRNKSGDGCDIVLTLGEPTAPPSSAGDSPNTPETNTDTADGQPTGKE